MKNVKVRFDLDVLEDDFPPVGSETLNGVLLGEDVIKLDNTPFFAEGVAIGDLLLCTRLAGDVFQYGSVLEPSGNKAISIIFIDDQCKESIYQHLKGMGCYCEYGEFEGFSMLALAVEEATDFESVVSYLDEKEGSGVISYAELCIA